MCTLTLLRERFLADRTTERLRWRVVFSRDEQRNRPQAIPPEAHRCGAVRALHPVDPQGGGTWIAATEHGLVFALLNGADPPLPAGDERGSDVHRRQSRGRIIPALAAAGVRRAADAPIDTIDPRDFRPFHLIVADDRALVEVVSDGRTILRAPACTDDRLMRTSSSVDTETVCAWRRRLFAQAAPDSAAAQDAFHATTVPEHPARGVAMARADACTVSVTAIDVGSSTVRMAYRPLTGEGAAPTIGSLEISPSREQERG